MTISARAKGIVNKKVLTIRTIITIGLRSVVHACFSFTLVEGLTLKLNVPAHRELPNLAFLGFSETATRQRCGGAVR
jgi:hypothetical protein